MKKPDTVRDVLLAAARLIGRKGWCRGNYKTRGRYCLHGAVIYAGGGGEYRPDLSPVVLARDALTRAGFSIGWNDFGGRKRSEVIAALRDTAKTATSSNVGRAGGHVGGPSSPRRQRPSGRSAAKGAAR